ncbi:MAG: hypothetical protein ACYDA0_02380 [Candidatus Dormibacteraceae bacterium]
MENRKLSISTCEDGAGLINGVFDPVGGAAIRTALEPLARKSGAHDDRSRKQRMASWSSGHHLVHWIHDGTNELPNLALLRHRHHWTVHEGSWQIIRGDDGRLLTVPPMVRFGAPSRGPD